MAGHKESSRTVQLTPYFRCDFVRNPQVHKRGVQVSVNVIRIELFIFAYFRSGDAELEEDFEV